MNKFYHSPIFTVITYGAITVISFIVFVFIIIKLESDPYIKETRQELPKAYTAIVLGAAILKNGTLSTIFKDRVDIAIDLYKEGYVETILVAGDDGTNNYNEVNPARDYLLIHGIPSEAIFLDHAGFDTYSSMYRARDIFLVKDAIVVTQSFHLPRAVFIARRLGIQAYGIPSDQHTYRFKNNIRETLANVKALLNVMYNRKPKYLGEEIPITGSSVDSI